MVWTPRNGEIPVPYDPAERELYEAGRPSIYDRWAWAAELLRGRDQRASRCFPEVAARAHFERLGYEVLLSAPKYPGELGYLLFHFRGLRRGTPSHPAFQRIQEHFPGTDLHDLAERGRLLKKAKCSSGGGGDPDLFVFRRGAAERFFVEVKDKDNLNCNQEVCFALIEEHLRCGMEVARLKPTR